MSKRYIVVDPSFTAHDGDRWQYAVNLAQSAHDEGYEFVMLTHRDAPNIASALDFGIQQRRVFGHAFYQHDKVYERHRLARPGGFEQARAAQRHSAMAMLQQRYGYGFLGRTAGLFQKIWWKTADLVTGPFRGNHVPLPQPFNRDDFALALARELVRLNPGPEDLLFFHTMTYGMMESLSEVTAALGHRPPFDTSAYFLFHFGAEAPDSRTYLDRYYSYSAYGSIAARMQVGAPFARMHYMVTSEILRQEADEILGAPTTVWDGLVNLAYLEKSLGGSRRIEERRAFARSEMARGEVRVVVRAADLDEAKAWAVSRACHLVQSRGNVVRLRILMHKGVIGKLRAIAQAIDFPNVDFINTNRNEDYISEICDACLVILPYDVDKYKKRVSAVLHDCAVLGVPALVPYGSTLADCDFSTKFVYGSNDDLLGTMLNAVRYLQRYPDAPIKLVSEARDRLAGNAVQRMLRSSPLPSQVRTGASPVANVVMPLWGRVGSSYAMEAQVRYLLGRGYFVNQVFLIDKPVKALDAIEYFWKMLRENSTYTRGSIQRVAYHDEADVPAGNAGMPAVSFDQFMVRIGRNSIHDNTIMRQMRKADVSVVNHVFHSAWAFRYCGGKRILETHDIQSYQMVAWPLLNVHTGNSDPIEVMLEREFEAVSAYDYVVNVSREEHLVLGHASRQASLVMPYLPPLKNKLKYKSIREMAIATGMHESYRYVESFDLLIIGDSHKANRESVVWFINEVFVPFLMPLGVKLAIVGRVSDVVYQEIGGIDHVFYAGFVEDLEVFKKFSRLVVLPDRRGTGISIKTLETLASALPFVGTELAFRGLREKLPRDLLTYDAPDAMAGAILEALADTDRRAELRDLAIRAYQAVASQEQFDHEWDEIFSRLNLPKA